MSLAQKSCVACDGGAPLVTREQAHRMLEDIIGWTISPDGTKLLCQLRFSNFAEAISYVNKVGEIAERENHHPDIHFGWGYVNLELMTHSLGGLHENDFIMAAKINELGIYNSPL